MYLPASCQQTLKLWPKVAIGPANAVSGEVPFTFSPNRPTRVEWRHEMRRWKKKKRRALTWGACVRASHLAIQPARTRRLYTARRVGGGSVMPTPRMSSGTRAYCLPATRAAGHRSRRYAAWPSTCPLRQCARVRLVQILRVGFTSGNLKVCRFRDSWLQANSTVIRLPLPADRTT